MQKPNTSNPSCYLLLVSFRPTAPPETLFKSCNAFILFREKGPVERMVALSFMSLRG